MSLDEKLQKIADASAKQIPVDAQKIMKRSTKSVADSILRRTIPKNGDPFPPFELPDSSGNIVRSPDLAKQGPFVVTFFRGKW